ncbi:hypothetical protein [Kitasatospora sp. NPDC097643]|uniref:hypothetical protein n=1 Tax=Kitasatospora sp. NPDC097643 TaxID=3157230 RepID=UPI003320B420
MTTGVRRKKWLVIGLVLGTAVVGATGWAAWQGGLLLGQVQHAVGKALSPTPPNVAELARSREAVAADRAMSADIDQRLGALIPAIPGTEVIGAGVEDGCGVGPSESDGFGSRFPAPQCRRQVVKYLAVTGDLRAAKSHWERALTTQGAQAYAGNDSPQQGDWLIYSFPRSGGGDPLRIRMAPHERPVPGTSPSPGAHVLGGTYPLKDGQAAWADRESRPAIPLDRATAQAFGSGRHLVEIVVEETYLTGPRPQ